MGTLFWETAPHITVRRRGQQFFVLRWVGNRGYAVISSCNEEEVGEVIQAMSATTAPDGNLNVLSDLQEAGFNLYKDPGGFLGRGTRKVKELKGGGLSFPILPGKSPKESFLIALSGHLAK